LRVESQAKCCRRTPLLDYCRGTRYKSEVKRSRLLLIIAILPVAGIIGAWRYYQWREHRFDAIILAAAQRYGVEPALVKAVVWRESWFNPRARGRAGEIGLMQIQVIAAQEWADAGHITTFDHKHCFDPGTNTLAGAWYLHKLLLRYIRTDNPAAYALADYNAGRSNVLKWNSGAAATNNAVFIEQIGFPGTKNYVKSVLKRYGHYRPIFRSDGS
jgi:soluble lytic murein transglycosylase